MPTSCETSTAKKSKPAPAAPSWRQQIPLPSATSAPAMPAATALSVNARAARVRQREASIERACSKVVAAAGGLWIKIHANTQAGVPDRLLCYRGRSVLVELKGLGGKLSRAQRAYHEQIRATGCRVEVIRSVAELQRLLISLDNR
jgi:hypothetical protein